jgi:uncharacterized protein (TIGR00255 family)
MISMTGYGRGACQVFGRRLVVEIRSVNHRFFDLKLRVPWPDATVEAHITAALKKKVDRGAVTLTVRDEVGGPAPEVRVNKELAKRYHQALSELLRELGMAGEKVPLDVLLSQRDVVTIGDAERSGDELFDALRPGLDGAVDSLIVMRKREGDALAKDLLAHAAGLSKLCARMSKLSQDAPEQYKKRLEERLARFTSPAELDPQRIAQEVAILADRTDVSEELVRLASHLSQFEGLCREAGPVGRKLDFLLQELNREINTIGSKAQSTEVAALVVEAKATLEKMREQAQNVE